MSICGNVRSTLQDVRDTGAPYPGIPDSFLPQGMPGVLFIS